MILAGAFWRCGARRPPVGNPLLRTSVESNVLSEKGYCREPGCQYKLTDRFLTLYSGRRVAGEYILRRTGALPLGPLYHLSQNHRG